MRVYLFAITLVFAPLAALAQAGGQDTRTLTPDIRKENAPLTIKDGDFVVVPIPISNPTLGTGLVAGAAYFYPQTQEQKEAEPPSVTGLGAMYTTSDSRALVLGHQSYWGKNRWRMTAAVGGADIRINLIQPDEEAGTAAVDWKVSGTFVYARLSHRIYGKWYGGVYLRGLDASQDIATRDEEDQSNDGSFELGNARIIGPGLRFEYDSRDLPMNPYTGWYFEGTALFNDEAFGSQQNYQAYSAVLRAYHSLNKQLVLAWEANSCRKAGDIPLWDACRIPLRGFPAFNYLGKVSIQGQAELRWRMTRRWGFVGFAGAGQVSDSYEGLSEDRSIPSYGFGVRFSVLPEQRINLRVDFAQSRDDEAVHISVAEAF